MGLILYPNHSTARTLPKGDKFTLSELTEIVEGIPLKLEADYGKVLIVNKHLFETGDGEYNDRASEMYAHYQDYLVFGTALCPEPEEI